MTDVEPRDTPTHGRRWWTDDASLYLGDALDVMGSWPDECIDGIVTSPEYADQRKYTHDAARGVETYAKRFTPYLAEMLRVVKPTGSLMLNLGVIMRKGEETAYADEVLAAARELGWKLLHRMVWHKKNPLPLSHAEYLTIAHEHVFWLGATTKVYRGYDGDTRTHHAEGSVRRIDEPYLRSKDERYARRGKANALHPDGARPTTVFSCAVGPCSASKPTRRLDRPHQHRPHTRRLPTRRALPRHHTIPIQLIRDPL